jgi:hypothetical protein
MPGHSTRSFSGETRRGVVASALFDLVPHKRAPLGRRFCFCRRMIEKRCQPRWQSAQWRSFGVAIPSIRLTADVLTWGHDHVAAAGAHIDAGSELTNAVLDRCASGRCCEIDVLATASGGDAPGWWQLGVLALELGQRAIATMPGIDIDHVDHGSGRKTDVGVGA